MSVNKPNKIYENLDKLYEENMEAYLASYPKQYELQEQEIGCRVEVVSHNLLLKAVSLPEKTPGGLIIPEEVRESLIKKYDIGLVIGAGPSAFMDRERFPTGPTCKIGDWIDFRKFEKETKYYNDYLCYVIHDDRINLKNFDLSTIVVELRQYK